MNLDNFNIGDAFLNDSWNRNVDQHTEDPSSVGDTDTMKVLKQYEKDKDSPTKVHNKILLDIDRIHSLIEKHSDANLHKESELLKTYSLNYVNKVNEYETWSKEGSLNTTAEERQNWQDTLGYLTQERTRDHDMLINQYNKIVRMLSTMGEQVSSMDLKEDRGIVMRWAQEIIKELGK